MICWSWTNIFLRINNSKKSFRTIYFALCLSPYHNFILKQNLQCGESVTIEGQAYTISSVTYRYQLRKGKYEPSEKRLDVLSTGRYILNLYLENLLDQSWDLVIFIPFSYKLKVGNAIAKVVKVNSALSRRTLCFRHYYSNRRYICFDNNTALKLVKLISLSLLTD